MIWTGIRAEINFVFGLIPLKLLELNYTYPKAQTKLFVCPRRKFLFQISIYVKLINYGSILIFLLPAACTMASLLRQVGRAYRRHPVICNVGLYGSLYFLGDLSQQTICRCPERNFQSARQVACVGAGVFGPFYYYWYRYLDGKVPGNAAKAVVKKMVLDQMVAGAGCVYIFYVGKSSFYMYLCDT